MNKDKKTIITASAILICLICIFCMLMNYCTERAKQVEEDSVLTVSDIVATDAEKAKHLSYQDGYEDILQWQVDLLNLKMEYVGSANAAIEQYNDFLSEEEISLLQEYEDKIWNAETITAANEQIDLFNAIIDEKAAEMAEAERLAASYSYNYGYNSVYYTSDNEEGNLSAKEWIAWRESGGDYNARNGQYIGRYQLSADKLDGDWSPEHQEEVADEYVANRYGSWEAAKDFWETHGWY